MIPDSSPGSPTAAAPDRRAADPRRRLFLVAIAIALVLTVSALAFTRLVPMPSATTSTGEAPAVLTVGAPAPALSGTTLDGRTLSLADLRGKPVVVNFWASWCGPCKQEFPAFKTVLARHQADGLQVLGVLFNDGPVPARGFVAQEGATWPTILDPSGTAAKTFEVFGAPESFLVDRSGVVRARMLGGLTESSLEQAIAPILR